MSDRIGEVSANFEGSPVVQVWRTSPSMMTIEADEIHVWRAFLSLDETKLDRLWQNLSKEELTRAGKFHKPEHRDRYVAARGCLREILSKYLRIEPNRVVFTYNQHGKPDLAEEHNTSALTFNLSHSHEIGLIVVGRGRLVGVDVERLRSETSGEQIARRFFSHREWAELSSLPEELHQLAFFNGWTRKEAFLKARGGGLTYPLDSFEVTLTPGQPATLLSLGGEKDQALGWTLGHINPYPGYVGALAAEGSNLRKSYWQWT